MVVAEVSGFWFVYCVCLCLRCYCLRLIGWYVCCWRVALGDLLCFGALACFGCGGLFGLGFLLIELCLRVFMWLLVALGLAFDLLVGCGGLVGCLVGCLQVCVFVCLFA